MREGWKTVKLGDVCRTGAGGTPLKSKNEYYLNGTIPWLMSGEVAQGNITGALHFITKSGLDNSSAKIFPVNTVLVAMYGATAGQVGILRFEASTNQAVCGILPNNRFIPEFLYYLFLQKKEELIAKATGNAQPNISQIKIKNTIIPLPPLPAQERIVAILDEAFAAIATATANTQKNLANAREVFESQLNVVFTQKGEGWEIITIEEISEVVTKGTTPTSVGHQFVDKGINFVKVEAVKLNGSFNKNKLAYIDANCNDALKRSQLRKGDLLFSIAGALGRVAVVTEDLLPANTNQALAIIRLINSQDIQIKYVYYVLSSGLLIDQIERNRGGVAQQNLSLAQVKSFQIPLPPLLEQERIVGQLDRLIEQYQNIELNIQQKLILLSELKQSILHKAFTGELTADPKSSARALKEAGL